MKEKYRKPVYYFVSLVAGSILIVMAIKYSGLTWGQWLIVWRKTTVGFWMLIGLVYGFLMLLRAMRWKYIVSGIAKKEMISGFYFFNTTLSLLTYIILNVFGCIGTKIASLKIEGNVDIKHGSLCTVLEMAMNQVGFCVMIIPAILYAFKILSAKHTIMLMILVGMLVILLIYKWHMFFLQVILKVFQPSSWLLKNKEPLDLSYIQNIFPSWTIKIIILSYMIYATLIATSFMIANELELNISLKEFIVIFPLIYVVIVFSITPGGIGINEVGWIWVLMFVGVDKIDAVSFAIMKRVADDLFLLIYAGLGYIFYLYQKSIYSYALREDKA